MTAHPALSRYLAANPAEAVRKYAAYIYGPNPWVTLAAVTKADAALEALCGELVAVRSAIRAGETGGEEPSAADDGPPPAVDEVETS